MGKKSGGILLYRFVKDALEVMLVHPGGPFWAKKDDGAWTIPKGEFNDGESAFSAAIREFEEELGSKINLKEYIELTPVKSKSNKIVFAFAAEKDFDVTSIKSNTCLIDWPPRSGKKLEIPEIDKAKWFDIKLARQKITNYQLPLIKELEKFKSRNE